MLPIIMIDRPAINGNRAILSCLNQAKVREISVVNTNIPVAYVKEIYNEEIKKDSNGPNSISKVIIGYPIFLFINLLGMGGFNAFVFFFKIIKCSFKIFLSYFSKRFLYKCSSIIYQHIHIIKMFFYLWE